MYKLLVFALVLSVVGQPLKVGYLTSRVNEVKIVRTVVPLSLNITPLLTVYDTIVGFEEDIEQISHDLMQIEELIVNKDIINHWKWQIDNVNLTLKSIIYHTIVAPDPTTTPASDIIGDIASARRKRGLFNFLGEAHKWLYGTATMADIEELRKLSNAQQNRININSELIQAQAKKLGEISVLFNRVIEQVNQLSNKMNDLYQHFTVDTLVASLHTQVTYYASLFSRMVMTLNLLTNGIVTPTLIPYSTLAGILEYARVVENLVLAVSQDRFEEYYSLIKVDFVNGEVFLYLPFVDRVNFRHFKIVPFPSFIHNQSVILTEIHSDVLIATDNSFMATPTKFELDECQRSLDALVCLPSKLNFYKPKTQSCEWAIIMNDNDLSMCQYKVYNQTNIQRHVLEDVNVLFFPKKTPIVLTCPESAPQPSQGFGRISVPKECTLSSNTLTIWGVDRASSARVGIALQDPVHINPHTLNVTLVPNIILPTINPQTEIPELTWIHDVVTDDSHPWITGIILFTLAIGTIAVIIFLVRRKCNKLRVLRTVVKTLPRDVEASQIPMKELKNTENVAQVAQLVKHVAL